MFAATIGMFASMTLALGLLLAVISTPVCYYVIRRIVIKYRLLREKARAKKSAEGRK